MRKIIILFLALTLTSCASFIKVYEDDSGSQWKLVYHNSAEGEKLSGNLNRLINVVKKGKEIRIVMNKESVISVAEAEYLWVKDDIVYAQNNGQVSVHFEGDDLVFQEDSYYWMFIVNTNGERNMIRWSVGEHEMRGENKDKVDIKWYIKN